jgi:hypothetical protein
VSADGETVATQTFTNVVTYTIPPPQTTTVTETVTVEAPPPTTTEPETTTTVEEPPPSDEFTPPARANTVENAPSGTTVANDTYYLNPQGTLSFPRRVQRVTVVGLTKGPWGLSGVKDVWLQGTPTVPIEWGPKVDADLFQIKAWEGVFTEDVTVRYFWMHDVTRTGSFHTDGLQLMQGQRVRFIDGRADNVSVQPYFVRDASGNGWGAGGGPIEDILFLRVEERGTTGFYSWRIAGDDEVGDANRYVPTRVRIVDSCGSKNIAMDAAVKNAGGEIVNYRKPC